MLQVTCISITYCTNKYFAGTSGLHRLAYGHSISVEEYGVLNNSGAAIAAERLESSEGAAKRSGGEGSGDQSGHRPREEVTHGDRAYA